MSLSEATRSLAAARVSLATARAAVGVVHVAGGAGPVAEQSFGPGPALIFAAVHLSLGRLYVPLRGDASGDQRHPGVGDDDPFGGRQHVAFDRKQRFDRQ